jgi:anti-anti-sigma factor
MPEALSVAVDVFEGVPVLRLRGALIYGQDLQPINRAAARLRSEGHERVIVDLAAVEVTDSTGVSALLETRRIFGERQGSVTLLRAPKRLRATLVMTHVASLFEVVEDEADLRGRLGRDGASK